MGNASLFQGNGGTAEVYEMLGHPGVCVKFITNQAKYNEGNHMRVEFGLLNKVRELKHGRVRTPTPYFLRIHPRDGHSYGMEKVDGKTLSQILEQPARYSDLVHVAKNLDRKSALEELSTFTEKMHSIHDVTHGDLHKRNIMLDRKGDLFIIDFGKARQHEADNALREMQRGKDFASLKSAVGSFFGRIDEL